ncbi:Acyl-CoA dehydrogenase [Rhodotorula toruloides]|uniref:Acyl-CoA dehydrogenase n=1 Tax=Rhodotorula toruloides TaxID=5286 RepID=A0A0K3CGH7_RHOTO|nr:Acyl-CoA dehydrogenase [Rhodotorula toruloides]PRQ73500.1 acyl-CoA dehydrogenase [Rhodotorula toruloides]
MAARTFSLEQISEHNKEGDLWIVVNGDVYDLSRFTDIHPGGAGVLLASDIAGKDASEAFFSLHRSSVLAKYKRLIIGKLDSDASASSTKYVLPLDGELSPVPYAEPSWLVPSYKSPYFKDSHRRLQKAMRKFFDENVKAEAREFELSGERPTQKLVELMGTDEWNIHAMRMGPGRHLHGKTLPGNVKGEEFDYFHELVCVQEMCRVGAPGYMAGLQAGMVIGLPPILNFAPEPLRQRILPDILAGKKFISLAISEPHAGSDVQGITTSATLSEDGKYWIVSGMKKWITNGHFSDYFMTAVRTGPKSLTMMLIERDADTVDTRKIKTSYSPSAGTAYVFFEKTKVPVENVLGGEGNGLKVILSNFNHERWVINCRIARYSRLVFEETWKWAHLRKSQGKRLIDNAVVRQKFGQMIARIDSGQAWLEHLTYQMTKMTYAEQSAQLAGPMALNKYYLARCGQEISDMAVQIWGGRGITQGGMGALIEQYQRTYKFDNVLGGADEVLADLGVRQASKRMPKAVL